MLFVIQHVLDDLAELVNAFVALGCEPPDITVIGIPYSSRQNAGDAIRTAVKCDVVLPPIFPMDGIVGKLLFDAVSKSITEKKPLIVLEDGGYAVPQLSQLAKQRLISLDHVKGAVEQTTRGKWLAERVKNDGYLALPVISIPDCGTKSNVEPPFIAIAAVNNLQDLLNHVDPGRNIGTVGVFGFGAIGSYVAKHFRKNNARVHVYDTDAAGRYRAKADGYPELNKSALEQCDLVIGATGSTSIGPATILSVKDGALIGSMSSRQIEIDMEHLYKRAPKPELIGPQGTAVLPLRAGQRHTLAQSGASKTLTVLYDGYPLNFWGTSLPDHVSDAVLSLLLEGVLALATGAHRPGVHSGATVLEEADIEITQMFRQIEDRLGLKMTG